MIRPFGIPPSPRARSRLRQPVGVVSICILAPLSPSFMTEPFPNCFSICASAASSAFCFSSLTICFSLSFSQIYFECLFVFLGLSYYIFSLLSSRKQKSFTDAAFCFPSLPLKCFFFPAAVLESVAVLPRPEQIERHNE